MKKIMIILAVIATLFMTGCTKEGQMLEFKSNGLTFYLPKDKDFEVVTDSDLDYFLVNDDLIGVYLSHYDIAALREEWKEDLSLEEFAGICTLGNDLLSEEKTNDRIMVSYVDALESGDLYTFDVFMQSSKCFYWLTFDCEPEDMDTYKEVFRSWALLVKTES